MVLKVALMLALNSFVEVTAIQPVAVARGAVLEADT